MRQPVVLALASLLALFVGLSLGLLGGGGSILTLPILRYVLEMEAHQAIAVSLFVVAVTSAVALVPHARSGRVRWKSGVAFGLSGMVGSFLAGRAAGLLPGAILLVLFGVMMLAAAFAMMRPRPSGPEEESADAPLPIGKIVADGLLVGFTTGLVGAGGGFLVVPALVLHGGLPIRVAVGTSLVVIAMQSAAGVAGHLLDVEIDWVAAGAVTALAVLGSVLGARLVARVSPARLRALFAWFVLTMALFFLGQELPRALGVTPPILLAAAIAVLGTLAVYGARALALRQASREEHP